MVGGGSGAQEVVRWDEEQGGGAGGASPPAPPILGGGGAAEGAAGTAAVRGGSPGRASQQPGAHHHHYHHSHHPLNPLVVVQMSQIGSVTSHLYRSAPQRVPGYTRNTSDPSTAAAAAAVRGDRSVTGLRRGPLFQGLRQLLRSGSGGVGVGGVSSHTGWSPTTTPAAAAAGSYGSGGGVWGAQQQQQPGWAVPLLDDGGGSGACGEDNQVGATGSPPLPACLWYLLSCSMPLRTTVSWCRIEKDRAAYPCACVQP